MGKIFTAAISAVLCLSLAPVWAADDDDALSSKEALQALNDFIGNWKGSGAPDEVRPDPRQTWKEKVSWSWRFKGDDAWLTIDIDNGKWLKSGELRYLPEKKKYQLTARTQADKKLVFVGAIKNDILTFERTDPDTKEVQRLKMNSAADGVRFIYRLEHKPAGRTLFYKDYLVACTKEGESLGATEKKIECPVSGGSGTIPVSFKGVTYFVCCNGCKEAFNENPEKYIKEYEKKKAAGN